MEKRIPSDDPGIEMNHQLKRKRIHCWYYRYKPVKRGYCELTGNKIIASFNRRRDTLLNSPMSRQLTQRTLSRVVYYFYRHSFEQYSLISVSVNSKSGRCCCYYTRYPPCSRDTSLLKK
jgi:hypothetical protein